MKKIIPLMILAAILFTVTAKAGMKNQVYTMGAFNERARVYIAADTVNVRSTPAMGNNIIDNLPAGFQVYIEKKSYATYIVDGLKAPWYQISYDGAKGHVHGFVWGGYISLAALPLKHNGKPSLILFAVKSVKNIGAIPVQAMIVSGASIVSKTGFDAIGIIAEDRSFGYSISAELHGSRGFSGISNVIILTFEYPACGYPFGSIVLLYNGSAILYGSRAISSVESGVYHSFTKFIFPDEKGGAKGNLVRVQTLENFDEAKKGYVLKEMKRTALPWTGSAFNERDR